VATLLDRPRQPAAARGAGRPARSSGATSLADSAAVRFHYLSLLLAYPALLWLGRNMWFREDEWRIVLGHYSNSRPLDIFAPFDVHWSTVTLLVYKPLVALVGASGYLPYLGVTLAIYLVAVHLLWRVLRRCGVDPWVAGLAVAAMLVLGAGWQWMYWALMISYTLPLGFTLGGVLLADRDELRPWHRAGIVAVMLCAEMCVGAGVAMMVVPALVVALRHGLMRGLATLALPVLAYAVWLDMAGGHVLDHPGGASPGMAGQVARFVWDGMSGSLAALVGPMVLGSVALVALGVWLGARWRRIGVPAPVPACAAGAVLVFLLTAVGRVNGGDATLPRYLAAGAALLMPAMALAVTDVLHALRRLRVSRASVAAPALVAAGLGVVVVHSAATLVGAVGTASADADYSHRALLAAAALSAREPSLPDSYPESGQAWAVTVADVVRLRDRGDLRPPATLLPGLAAEIRLHIRVALSVNAVPTLAPPVITGVRHATLRPDGDCTVAIGSGPDLFEVSVSFPAAGALRIVPLTPEEVLPFLHGSIDAPSDIVESASLVGPGETRYLDDIAPGSAVVIRFLPGSVRLCG
jgi:hypothetical protein